MEWPVMIERIALIGFGEVGQALAPALLEATGVTAFDPKFSDTSSPQRHAAEKLGIGWHDTAEAAATGADLIVSAVTAAETGSAANSVMASISKDAWFLDLNSAAPRAKIQASETIASGGGRYIEASIMSPIMPKRMAAPIFLGGPYAETFETTARAIGFSNTQAYSAKPGKTAAVKLCRSVVIKGMEALLTESLLSARYYGVEEDVLASLSNLLPHPDWQSHARYMICRTVEHGVRRAEEMQEAALTVSDASITPWMSEATVLRQSWAADHAVKTEDTSLGDLLDGIRADTSSQSPKQKS